MNSLVFSWYYRTSLQCGSNHAKELLTQETFYDNHYSLRTINILQRFHRNTSINYNNIYWEKNDKWVHSFSPPTNIINDQSSPAVKIIFLLNSGSVLSLIRNLGLRLFFLRSPSTSSSLLFPNGTRSYIRRIRSMISRSGPS